MSAALATSGPVLVTGGTGFLGEHVCAELTRAGVKVRALARSLAMVAVSVAVAPKS